ncbi:MAG: hypothetical protein WAN31_02710 [Methylovirgula sp.]|jgi:hypothetical protein
MNIRTKIAAAAAATTLALLVASSASATMEHMTAMHHMVTVMESTMATMKDGTKLHVEVVKMNGRTMVMIPAEDLPDYLHQQIFKVMH